MIDHDIGRSARIAVAGIGLILTASDKLIVVAAGKGRLGGEEGRGRIGTVNGSEAVARNDHLSTLGEHVIVFAFRKYGDDLIIRDRLGEN